MKKKTYYMGNERGTHYFNVEDGNVIGTELKEYHLLDFLMTAEKLGFKWGLV